MLRPRNTPGPEELRKNMLSTYFYLRAGIVALSAALPVALVAYSLIAHGTLEERSMSAFYGAYDGAMRNWFVGTLCAVGAFLALYKGFSFLEDMLLNAAGLFAVLTALKPCNCWDPALTPSKLHATFAILFFASMALVCFTCALNTISLLPDAATQDRFRRKYRAIGVALVVSPAAAIVLSYFATRKLEIFIFVFEAVAVWVFAYYWFTKTQEFEITSAEKKALRGELAYAGDRLVQVPSGVMQP